MKTKPAVRTWPQYALFINAARSLANHSGIPRANAGAGLFAVAAELLGQELWAAALSAWLRRQADEISGKRA